ncbi:hypothetical protein EGW08_009931 [Elysia chlorotica]|uniref:Flavin-containing monooxygenase n=1 Tax=Elysia chlorotica TaxID=188477 RepID=A0A3S0ZNX2_ELYCH|nr:hypothetical protein EGW08_009931 [Elysia chlorotica]
MDRGRMELYNLTLPVGEKHHTLAFLGFLAGDGAPAQAIELQARYISRLITGKVAPPTQKAIKHNLETIKNFSIVRKGKFTYKVPLLKLCDLIACEIGVYPWFWRVFLRDPVLAFMVWYGPIFTAQYRLLGPDSDWDRARAACYRAYDVISANGSQRDKVKVKRDDVTVARRRQVLLFTCGISAMFALGYLGKSRNLHGAIAQWY